ncbi:hypothetical protein Droror1_Dr00017682 [Drosera rotundifolia]
MFWSSKPFYGNLKQFCPFMGVQKLRCFLVVYFVNSGTEANELASLYTGNLGMISLRNAYHGEGVGALGLTALSTWKYSIPQGEVHHVLNLDPYRGVFGSDVHHVAVIRVGVRRVLQLLVWLPFLWIAVAAQATRISLEWPSNCCPARVVVWFVELEFYEFTPRGSSKAAEMKKQAARQTMMAALYLIASMGVLSIWSLGLACLDAYAMTRTKDFCSPAFVSLCQSGVVVVPKAGLLVSCCLGVRWFVTLRRDWLSRLSCKEEMVMFVKFEAYSCREAGECSDSFGI